MEQRNRIMVVDDNLIDQMITAHVLKNINANGEIMVMENATKALEYLYEHQNNPSAMPSLIVLDLDMPGLNGLGFLEKFKGFREEVKSICRIVVLTASEIQADIEHIQAHPDVCKLILKPLDKNAFAPII
ncbi:response regulator [Pedobacter sp. UC225_61]|uniref:response regulator n=1 Tax=Pedobacter sp. UC225_61 TaxID=3374623 RepID=UPI0037A6937C